VWKEDVLCSTPATATLPLVCLECPFSDDEEIEVEEKLNRSQKDEYLRIQVRISKLRGRAKLIMDWERGVAVRLRGDFVGELAAAEVQGGAVVAEDRRGSRDLEKISTAKSKVNCGSLTKGVHVTAVLASFPPKRPH